MIRPEHLEVLDGYRLRLRYSDGTEGVVDLSPLVGKGVFKVWKDLSFFATARIAEGGAIAWGSEIDLCPDALYLQITGKKPEDFFPHLNMRCP